jgi:hypothetical protein
MGCGASKPKGDVAPLKSRSDPPQSRANPTEPAAHDTKQEKSAEESIEPLQTEAPATAVSITIVQNVQDASPHASIDLKETKKETIPTFQSDGNQPKQRKTGGIKTMSSIIWKSQSTGEIQRLMQEFHSAHLPTRGLIFLSFVGVDNDAAELRKCLQENHQYEVVMCNDITDPDELQNRIRYRSTPPHPFRPPAHFDSRRRTRTPRLHMRRRCTPCCPPGYSPARRC